MHTILCNAQVTLAYRNAEIDIPSWCESRRYSEEVLHMVTGSELLADLSTFFFYTPGTIFAVHRMQKLKRHLVHLPSNP